MSDSTPLPVPLSPGPERRSAPRLAGNPAVRGTLRTGPAAAPCAVQVGDVSRFGISLITDHPAEPAGEVLLDLPGREGAPTWQVRAWVVHSTALETGAYLLGCALLRPLGDEELRNLSEPARPLLQAGGRALPTKAIRLVIAEDFNIVRAGLRTLLQRFSDIEVVGEAENGTKALQLIKELKPDVLLTDITMPQMDGLELTAQALREQPGLRVLILSVHADEEYVLHAFRAGAAGYLIKEGDIAELELAIKTVARCQTYLSPEISKHVVGDYVRRLGGPPVTPETLTPRQREILQLIAEGRSTKEMARLLHLSVKTVESHRAQLMERLDIHEIAGLVRYAIRTGVVQLE